MHVTFLAPRGALTEPPAQVVVMFDRPMVAIGDLGAPGRTVPVEVAPETEVRGHWVGTSIGVLAPARPFRLATRYTVRVPAGTRSAAGGRLAAEVAATFETPRPAVARAWLDPDEVLGSGTWVALRPARPIPQDTVFALEVRPGLAGRSGALASGDPGAGAVRWVVDGRPGPVCAVNEPCRWPLAAGRHTFALLSRPDAAVRITVRERPATGGPAARLWQVGDAAWPPAGW